MSEEERLDRCVQGLNFEISLEVLKTQASDFEEATRILLGKDSALWSFANFRTSLASAVSTNDFIEIGNIQRTVQLNEIQRRQRVQGINNNAGVVYQKKYCRP